MLHAVEGVLRETPQNQLKTENGRPCIRTTLNVGKDFDIPVPIVAWDYNAEHLADLQAGQHISFVGTPTSVDWPDANPSMGFEVQKIDENGLLILANDKILSDFAKAGKRQKMEPAKASKRAGIRRTASREKSINRKEQELSL